MKDAEEKLERRREKARERYRRRFKSKKFREKEYARAREYYRMNKEQFLREYELHKEWLKGDLKGKRLEFHRAEELGRIE